MSELVQDVCQKFRLEAENKGLQLFTSISTQPAFISADIGLVHRVLENLIENAAPESIFVYWNLMVPRRMSVNSDLLIHNETKSEELSKIDKGFFYSNFIVDVKR